MQSLPYQANIERYVVTKAHFMPKFIPSRCLIAMCTLQIMTIAYFYIGNCDVTDVLGPLEWNPTLVRIE